MPYSYTTRSPSTTRFTATDVPGHRLGMVTRRDSLLPDKVSRSFKPYCECGAKCDTWFTSKKLAALRWHEPHAEQAARQLSLPL